MSPIKIGFVGLSKEGWAALAIVPNLLKAPLVDQYILAAVSTSHEASASESAEKYSELTGNQVQAFHGDTARISGDPDVDLVAVAVKAPSHKAALLPAIAAGKDVFVEWPAGNGFKECSELADASRSKGIRSMVGLQGRQSLVVNKIKGLISSGAIGKIQSSTIIALAPRELGYWGPTISERNVYTANANEGATMSDIAVGHLLDSFIYILGGFASVSATTATQYPTATVLDASQKPTDKKVPVTGADHVAFTGVLESGAISSITWRGGYVSTKGRKQFIWEIDGEEGSIRVENDAISGAFIHIREPQLYLNGELVEVQGDGFPGNLTRLWGEFAKGSEGKYATLDDAAYVHRVLDAIERSSQEGRRIDLL